MSNGPPGEPPPGSADELRGPTVLRMILGTQLRRPAGDGRRDARPGGL